MVTVLRSLSPDGVLSLTLNRPDKRNAMNDEMAGELRDHVVAAAADPAVRCVVLAGAGVAFCAGGDIAGMGERTGPEAVARLHSRGTLVEALVHLPQPLVAAVRGAAAGGGFSLALACDVVFASDTAFFRQAFLDLGLAPDMGYTYFLPRQVGSHRAKEITLSGRRIDAAEAHALGIVARVCPDAELDDAVREFAGGLAARSPIAVTATKRMLHTSLGHDLRDAIELEAFAYGVTVGTAEHSAAVARFRDGRRA